MPRGPMTFKQADLTRALRAARGAGVEIGTIEVTRDGTIRILTGPAAPLPTDHYDAWKAKRDARPAQRA